MKHIRNTTLFYCILSLTLISGCSLDEPYNMDLKCHDNDHELSQIIKTTINNNQNDITRCLKTGNHDNNCFGLELNLETGYCPKDYGCIHNEANRDYTYSCADMNGSYFNETETIQICGENQHLIILDDKNSSLKANPDPKRCSAINHIHGIYETSIIGYCCDDNTENCGEENKNCVQKVHEEVGWKTSKCQNKTCVVDECDDKYTFVNGECTSLTCDQNQHIYNHQCEQDTDSICGDNRLDCTSISSESIPHASSTFKCINGLCQLKCEETYQASEDNTYCYSDSDIEHCGSNNINCNNLQSKSIVGFKGLECRNGQCTPICQDNYRPHTPIDGDIQDGYYCAATCDNKQCGANSECKIHYEECWVYSIFYKTCVETDDSNNCIKYYYYSYDVKYDENNESFPTDEHIIDEEEYSKLIKDISSKPLYSCLEQSNDECIAHQYCLYSDQVSKCDCVDGYEVLANKCVPICKDGFIDIYWDGEVVKAHCIQSEDDLVSIKCNSHEFYYLKNDIDLGQKKSWLPICSAGQEFKGVFWGNNHTIQANLTCDLKSDSCGLFGNVYSSTFSDLNLNMTIVHKYDVNQGNHITIGKTGTLASYAIGSSFSNINVHGYTESKYNSAGGMIGMGINNTFTGCSFSGNIKSKYAGGILGSANTNSSIDIAPKIPVARTSFPTILTHCHVSGSLEGTYSGGLIAKFDTDSTINISDSSFSGIVTGEFVGGLAGFSNTINISNSYVINADLSGNINSKSVVGGLVGSADSFNINNSYVTHSNLTGFSVGGLIGFGKEIPQDQTPMPSRPSLIKYSTSILNSYFDGNIKAQSLAGGLVGKSTNASISGSAVFGNIYIDIDKMENNSTIGGFIGYMNSGYIINSMSSADINHGEIVGLFGGLLSIKDDSFLKKYHCFDNSPYSPMYISNSYVTGKVYWETAPNYLSSDLNIVYDGDFNSTPIPTCSNSNCSTNNILNSRICYVKIDNSSIATYFDNARHYMYMIDDFIKYDNAEPKLNSDSLIKVLNSNGSCNSFENRLCTISTGPSSIGPGEGIPTNYLLPIPKSLPPIPFCEPYTP